MGLGPTGQGIREPVEEGVPKPDRKGLGAGRKRKKKRVKQFVIQANKKHLMGGGEVFFGSGGRGNFGFAGACS